MESTKSTIGRTSTDQRCIVAPCRTCGGSGKIATSQYVGPCQACDGDGRVVFTGSDVDLMLAAQDLLHAASKMLEWFESMKGEAFDRMHPDDEGEPGDSGLQNFLIDHQPYGFGIKCVRDAIAKAKGT